MSYSIETLGSVNQLSAVTVACTLTQGTDSERFRLGALGSTSCRLFFIVTHLPLALREWFTSWLAQRAAVVAGFRHPAELDFLGAQSECEAFRAGTFRPTGTGTEGVARTQ